MIFERSGTNQDAVSMFTPESSRAAQALGGGRMKMGRMGRGRMMVGAARRMHMGDAIDEFFGWGTPEPTEPASSSWGWLSEIGDVAAQIYAVKTQADLQEMNMQRAAQGLAPIPSSAVAPQVNVGIAGDTQKTMLMLGLGVAGILGVAFATGMIGRKRRR